MTLQCRFQWPRGLRRWSTAARLLRSWVRIPLGAWMSVCCECCVLSGRGLCDELISRPEESYRLWCVVVCDLETSRKRRPWPTLGRSATAKKKKTSSDLKIVVTVYDGSAVRQQGKERGMFSGLLRWPVCRACLETSPPPPKKKNVV